MSVLVFVETDHKMVKGSSLEAITYGYKIAQQLGMPLYATAMGTANTENLAELGHYGAEKVFHLADSRMDSGIIQATSTYLVAATEKAEAQITIMPKSSLVDAVASRVAIRIGAAVATNVVALPDFTDGFIVKRGVYSGKAVADVKLEDGKKIITIKKSAVNAEKVAESTATITPLEVNFSETDFGVKQTNVEKAEDDILLPEADKVISAGRGLKGPENWAMVEELAKTLGAATACSKPVSDMEWRPHHEHVGQTGIKISPNLYIAIGISGAIQHLAGVNSSKTIVVINKDADAPFFKAADYGIVGDAFDVVPKLTAAFKEVL